MKIEEEIWERKYKLGGENSINESLIRVAKGCSVSAEEAQTFSDILTNKYFFPGGRILSNAGSDRTGVTLFNCYVSSTIEDTMEGIMDVVKEAALTQKQGGGIGYDFSTIRPKGAQLNSTNAIASGPLSFMKIFDTQCKTIMAAGSRRGAQMAVLRCDHPDIEEFITAKQTPGELTMFNLSVGITDAFISAVNNDSDWDLIFDGKVYKKVKAKDLWDLIMKSTYNRAEPGFLLIDRINQMNNLSYCETIAATNPC